MQPGDLVRITRSSIILPAGSVGLILRSLDQTHIQGGYTLLEVHFGKHSARRVLDRDLEVINATG